MIYDEIKGASKFELLKEFNSNVEKNIWMYNTTEFLHKANKVLNTSVQEVDEFQEAKGRDEDILDTNNQEIRELNSELMGKPLSPSYIDRIKNI